MHRRSQGSYGYHIRHDRLANTSGMRIAHFLHQLRHLCRQLYLETNALGIKYITVNFLDNNHGSAYSLFARFCALGPPETLQKSNRVVILDTLIPSRQIIVEQLMELFFGSADIVDIIRA